MESNEYQIPATGLGFNTIGLAPDLKTRKLQRISAFLENQHCITYTCRIHAKCDVICLRYY